MFGVTSLHKSKNEYLLCSSLDSYEISFLMFRLFLFLKKIYDYKYYMITCLEEKANHAISHQRILFMYVSFIIDVTVTCMIAQLMSRAITHFIYSWCTINLTSL